jgi:hypothetical protein
MTVYTLFSGQNEPLNAVDAPHVVVSGMPTRGRVRLRLNGASGSYTQASLWAQTALTPYNYAQQVPLVTMAIPPGEGVEISQDIGLDLSYYNFLFGQLDAIDRSQTVAATLTLDV